MKNTASIQKNQEMEIKVHGMYGSTVNAVDRGFRTRAHAGSRAKVHPGEAGIVSGRRIRIDTPSRPVLQSVGRFLTLRNILLFLISGIFIAAAVILMLFNFEYATIYGNTKYSSEQIESFITQGYLGENTFVMAVKYHHRKVSDIPFVDRIDIDIVNPSTVRVNITEKPTDGCIFYNGNNVYFSKEGIIQTVSGRKVEDTTIVNGVVLTHSNTGTQIMAKNQLGLDLSLELMRAADKYGVQVDTIDVDARNNLTFSIGDVKVRIGKTGYDNKMFRLHRIYPYLEGRSGVISMSGYKDTYDSNYNIVLSPEGSEAAVRAAAEIEEAEAEAEAEEAAEKSGEEPAAAEAEEEAGAAGEEQAEEAAQVIGSASQGSQTTASAAPESIPVPRKSP